MVMLSLSLPRWRDLSLWLFRNLLLAPQGIQVLGKGVVAPRGEAGDRRMEEL